MPSDELFKNYGRPEPSYLAGITLSVTSKRWMSSFSGCLDVSFSHVSVSVPEYSYSHKDYSSIKHTGTMLSGKLGIRYTYPRRNIRPFAEFGMDISSLLASRQWGNSIEQNWMDGIFLGYYANVGVNIVVSKKYERMIFVRTQFRDIYERMEKFRLMTG